MPAETVTATADTANASDDGGVISGNVLTNDVSGGDDPLHVSSTGAVTSARGATVTLGADGSYSYNPETVSGIENLSVGTYTDSFSYTASDGHGATRFQRHRHILNVPAEPVTATTIPARTPGGDDGGVIGGNVLTNDVSGADPITLHVGQRRRLVGGLTSARGAT